ncbi:MAG: Holliday junction branch migration protein RuvA [Microbacteriaceae bacterium]
MIASLRGTITAQGSGYLIIEVAGIGYQVLVTEELSRKARIGEEMGVSTRLIVREDALTLYGFEKSTDILLFDEFLKVSGVGPKSALNLLNDLSLSMIVHALKNADEKTFLKVSGIGPKTARLIIATLQGRLTEFAGASEESTPTKADFSEQLLSALVSLGWSARDSESQVDRMREQGLFAQDYDLSQLLKLALVGLAPQS